MTSKEARKVIKLCKKQMKATRRFNEKTEKLLGARASVNISMNCAYIMKPEPYRELCKALGKDYSIRYERAEEGLSVWLDSSYDGLKIKCYKETINDADTEND